jgi:hypothetical protein
MANQFKEWTSEELTILKNEYPKLGFDVHNLLPQRTVSSIQTKATKVHTR